MKGKIIKLGVHSIIGWMKKGLFQIIFRDKPAMVLLALLSKGEQAYASSLAKEADCTYPHIMKILDEFNKRGMIKVSSRGRIKPIALTPKGCRIADKLKELRTLCEQN